MASRLRLAQDQTLSEQTFSRGIVSDTAPHALPQGSVIDMRDFLADIPGVLRKRGGTEYHSADLADDLMVAVMTPEFPGDPRVLGISSTGSTRTLRDLTDPVSLGDSIVLGKTQPVENPPLYVDRLILCDGTGDGLGVFEAVKSVTVPGGTLTVADLGGTPPNTRYSTVHLGRIVLANGSDPNDGDAVHENRLWFSPVPNVEATWDTATAYIDVPESITGLASVNGVLLVFTRSFTWRILREFPPGSVDSNDVPNENMELQPLGAIGCIDARSIVKKDGLVYFANESGIYYTNAAGYGSITSKDDGTGIQQRWSAAVAGFSPVLGSVVCGGVWLNDNLFFTVRHTDTDPQEGTRYQFLWHGQTGAWTTLSDATTADMYATRFAPEGEIYAACGNTADNTQLLKLSGLFAPTNDNSADANGDLIEPFVVLRPFYGGPGVKAFGWGHLTYELVEVV